MEVENCVNLLDEIHLDKENESHIRHCALCLIAIPPNEVKCCSKCHRRAYCSKTCQAKDWSRKGTSQGHRDWCGVDYGEVDVDWEICDIPGRGRGLRALRDLPPNFRIIVEGFDSQKEGLSNLSRLANHECDSNAAEYVIRDAVMQTVLTMYSKRAIQKGEEICVNYTSHNAIKECSKIKIYSKILDPSSTESEKHRKILQTEFKIICPPACFCRRTEIEQQIEKNLSYETQLERKGFKKSSPKKLKVLRQLLSGLEFVHSPAHVMAKIAREAAINILENDTTAVKKAEDILREADKFCSSIYHPKTYENQ